MKAISTKVYSLDIKDGFLESNYIGKLNGRNIVPYNSNILTNEFSDKSKTKILVPSEAKVEASVVRGTTVRHPQYLNKIVPYETDGAKIPFEINCICFYERAVVDYLRIEKFIEADEKKKLFSRNTIGKDEFQIKPAWDKNEVVICKEDDVSLKFNGKKLSLLKNGNEVKYWKAYAGAKGFQNLNFQKVKDKGPLPEGKYNVNRSNIQFWKDAEFWRKVIAQMGLGVWKGGTSSWGQGRIILEPNRTNNMYGRSGFTIHGGTDPYSKGCIDLVENEVDFLNDFIKIDKDMILEVKY